MSAKKGAQKFIVDIDRRRAELSRTSHWSASRRGPLFLNPVFRLGDRSLKHIEPFVKKGDVAADIGCGWGYFSFALANRVGETGKVYSVDLAQKVISRIQKKAAQRNFSHIEAHHSSAADLSFIPSRTVDIVFANGLLCSMAVDREAAVDEIKRILKPNGHAYISLGAAPPWGYVDEAEWKRIMQGFLIIVSGGSIKEPWAVVSVRQVAQ